MQPPKPTVSERAVGFVAQEVEQLIKANGYVFSKAEKPQNEHDHYSLRYAEFMVPLTKAAQELSAKNKAQQELAAVKSLLYGVLIPAESPPKTTTSVEGFMLHQNVPNPFDKISIICASLPENVQQAKIIVYNLQRLELENYPFKRQRNISVKILKGRSPSGIYLYALVADGQVIDVKKMVLTK